ncbi:MAG TPA: class I SAM-dependent RNA methyltransferase [Terracidiphilus sp.]|nr:class I SAM-dependent RNA methyltransferase [Terracidiphilus sp.]
MKPPRNQPTQPNPAEAAFVRIEKPIYGGAFLARIEGKAVFVPMALPGEEARVRVTQDKPGYSSAEIHEIVSSSPDRTTPECPHFGPCGGCAYQHANYPAQLRFKQAILRETLERGGVRAPEQVRVLSAEPWRYRNRIRLGFDAHGNPGYRGRRSHAIVPISQCPISAPLLVKAALACADLARNFAPALRLTGLALFCNPSESAILATMFTGNPAHTRFEEFVSAFAGHVPQFAGGELALESRTGEPQRILARWGTPSITYPAAGFDYRVGHGAFFQVNRWLVDPLVECVTASYKGALAWDLFAGVGLFARRLTSTFDRVIVVESAPAATAALEHNLSGTCALAMKSDTLAFLRRNARGPRPDLIVADPPRTGLGADVCAALAEIAAPAIVYVSCDPATLSRDLRALIAGGYAIQSVTLADLFPETFHLETVVHLRHAQARA